MARVGTCWFNGATARRNRSGASRLSGRPSSGSIEIRLFGSSRDLTNGPLSEAWHGGLIGGYRRQLCVAYAHCSPWLKSPPVGPL